MRQKGQIPIIVLLIIVVGIVFFKGSSFGLNLLGSPKTQKPPAKLQPVLSKPSAIIAPPSTVKPAEEKIILPPDNTPPKRSDAKPSGVLPADTRRIGMSLKTDEKSICKYSDVAGLVFDSMRSFTSANATSHSVMITTLSEGQEYKYYIKCADEKNNQNSDDLIISFKVKMPDDTAPPERFYLDPSGVLPYTTRQTTIGVTTNEPASCRYASGPDKSYSSMSSDQTKHRHTANVSGLKSGQTYDYFVRCRDLAGNENTGDAMIRFSIGI